MLNGKASERKCAKTTCPFNRAHTEGIEEFTCCCHTKRFLDCPQDKDDPYYNRQMILRSEIV